MPFGDNTKVYRLALPPGELPKPGERLPARLMKDIPEVDAPWWWSEYLLDEWKRKHGLTKRCDGRTKWQQDKDQWEHREMMQRGGELMNNVRPGAPRHAVWEPETPEPLFPCRCSASGSQGHCAFGAETAEAMQMHYLEHHGWATSPERVVSLDARYRAIAEQAAR